MTLPIESFQCVHTQQGLVWDAPQWISPQRTSETEVNLSVVASGEGHPCNGIDDVFSRCMSVECGVECGVECN